MQMKEIDELCRLCAQQLDISISKNIFAPENKNLLTVILQSIPISVCLNLFINNLLIFCRRLRGMIVIPSMSVFIVSSSSKFCSN